MRTVAIILGFAAGILGCQSTLFEPPHCRGGIAAARLPHPGERLHLRAALTHNGKTQRHEAVVEISEHEVRISGLTPVGTRAYVLVDRRGRRRDLDNRMGQFLGLDPELLYDAVARAWIVPQGVEISAPAVALAGSAESVTAPTSDTLRYVGSHSEREWARVTFDAKTARVSSPACGYEARIVTLDRPAFPRGVRRGSTQASPH